VGELDEHFVYKRSGCLDSRLYPLLAGCILIAETFEMRKTLNASSGKAEVKRRNSFENTTAIY
jgi:hypothetical protein